MVVQFKIQQFCLHFKVQYCSLYPKLLAPPDCNQVKYFTLICHFLSRSFGGEPFENHLTICEPFDLDFASENWSVHCECGVGTDLRTISSLYLYLPGYLHLYLHLYLHSNFPGCIFVFALEEIKLIKSRKSDPCTDLRTISNSMETNQGSSTFGGWDKLCIYTPTCQHTYN